MIMKDRYIKILLTVIAINLTVLTLNSVVDRFVPDAMAANNVQKVALCTKGGNFCLHPKNLY